MNIQRLKEIRKDNDLSQKDIAKVLATSQVQYSRYEMGIRLLPIDKLAKLAKYYNTSTDYLLGLTDERKPYPKSILINNKNN
jgi:transcriptional regulator with XRE-family HTH domain